VEVDGVFFDVAYDDVNESVLREKQVLQVNYEGKNRGRAYGDDEVRGERKDVQQRTSPSTL